LREGAQARGGAAALTPEQLSDHHVVVDLLGGDSLGFQQRGDGCGVVAALPVGAGHVDVNIGCEHRAPFEQVRRERAGVDGAGDLEGLAGVAQLDRDGHGAQGDVGGAEGGRQVVAIAAKPVGRLAGFPHVGVGVGAVVALGGGDGAGQRMAPHTDRCAGPRGRGPATGRRCRS
jgi:hypothetical protein